MCLSLLFKKLMKYDLVKCLERVNHILINTKHYNYREVLVKRVTNWFFTFFEPLECVVYVPKTIFHIWIIFEVKICWTKFVVHHYQAVNFNVLNNFYGSTQIP